MANFSGLLRLIAETESVMTRETENLLAGNTTSQADAIRKTELTARLMEQAPHIGHLAFDASADEKQQLRDGFERMLHAAARNEVVLRGALRGARLIVGAMREASDPYTSAPYSSKGSKPSAKQPAGDPHYNRFA